MVRERPRLEDDARAAAMMDSPAPPRAARDTREESIAAGEEEEFRTEPLEDAEEAGPALLLLLPRLDSEEENAVALAAQGEMMEHDIFMRFS